MQLFRASPDRSEDDYIEGVRRNLAQFDRWRPLVLGLYGIAAVVFVGGLILSVVIVEKVGWFAQVPLRWHGFVFGLMLGATLGLSAVKVAHGLGLMLFGLRNERLLVRYYDEVKTIRRGPEHRADEDIGPS